MSVGIAHDTAESAAATIRRWRNKMGRARLQASELMITAASGSNGARTRLRKAGLRQLAEATDPRLNVCHFPPGSGRWNEIAHRLFSLVTKNWRGKPLVTHRLTGRVTSRTQSGRELARLIRRVRVALAELWAKRPVDAQQRCSA